MECTVVRVTPIKMLDMDGRIRRLTVCKLEKNDTLILAVIEMMSKILAYPKCWTKNGRIPDDAQAETPCS